jgi:GNAT superfamily N-acetyltransferase
VTDGIVDLTRAISGPHVIRPTDIDAVNRVFTDAFTERYRRDGMAGVRVPALNPTIWRYAIQDAQDGAMLWRDGAGEVIAFNVVHRSGHEGWMGPLCVKPEWQGRGVGKRIVTEGIVWLKANAARVIGLETMPRTMDNIGFYSALGFVPDRLTLTVTVDASSADAPLRLLGSLKGRAREDALDACTALCARVASGHEFTREIELTGSFGLGDTVLVYRDGELHGFAIFHSVPLVEGRAREELRVLKMVLSDEHLVGEMAQHLAQAARRTGTLRASMRVQGAYVDAYSRLVQGGAKVRWSDLRMTLRGYHEVRPEVAMVLSNWEI